MLGFRKKKLLHAPDQSQRVDLPAPMSVVAEVKKAEFEKRIQEVNQLVGNQLIEPHYERPDYDLTRFCFGNKEYICDGSITFSADTGEALNDSRRFLADADALNGFLLDLDDLESTIDGARFELPSLPNLRTKMSLLKPVHSVSDIEENHVCMILKPFTKTGRLAKYPVEIHFFAHEYIDDGTYCPLSVGANGTVFYLKNGGIGKAWAAYHLIDAMYLVKWKQRDDWLYVDSIDYHKRGEYESVRVFQSC